MDDTDTMDDEALGPQPGDMLTERYRLEEQLGEGGMGAVFRGEHVLMEKKVAIKTLHPEITDKDTMVARFRREAKSAAALDHPNICRVTDFGQSDEGAFFLVMEYLDGHTLSSLIELYDRLSANRALHIARQIASALEVAHREGIVHRDLKPDNVMIVDRHGDSDTVKLTDFGIAFLLASTSDDEDAPTRLTRTGLVFGTPRFMAPEQIAGDGVDARTDLYALGTVLFEMLTGSIPYDADNVARVMGMHMTSPVPRLSQRAPDVDFPQGLQKLVDDLMAKDPEDRPASAGEVIDRIDAIVAGEASAVRAAAAPMASRGEDEMVRSVERRGVALWRGLSRHGKVIAAGLVALFFLLMCGATAITIAFVAQGDGDEAAGVTDGDEPEAVAEEIDRHGGSDEPEGGAEGGADSDEAKSADDEESSTADKSGDGGDDSAASTDSTASDPGASSQPQQTDQSSDETSSPQIERTDDGGWRVGTDDGEIELRLDPRSSPGRGRGKGPPRRR